MVNSSKCFVKIRNKPACGDPCRLQIRNYVDVYFVLVKCYSSDYSCFRIFPISRRRLGFSTAVRRENYKKSDRKYYDTTQTRIVCKTARLHLHNFREESTAVTILTMQKYMNDKTRQFATLFF